MLQQWSIWISLKVVQQAYAIQPTTLRFPSCSQDFIVRIVPLFKLTLIEKVIMEDTQQLTYSIPIPLTSGSWHVPPLLVPIPFSDTTLPPSSISSEHSTTSTSTGSSFIHILVHRFICFHVQCRNLYVYLSTIIPIFIPSPHKDPPLHC